MAKITITIEDHDQEKVKTTFDSDPPVPEIMNEAIFANLTYAQQVGLYLINDLFEPEEPNKKCSGKCGCKK